MTAAENKAEINRLRSLVTGAEVAIRDSLEQALQHNVPQGTLTSDQQAQLATLTAAHPA